MIEPDPDDTISVRRPKPRASPWPWLGAGAIVLALSGGGTWFAWHGTPSVPPPQPLLVSVPASVPAPPSVAVAPQVALPMLAGEADILAREPDATEAYRFRLQPSIMVVQFASLAAQADALNRAAAMLEKAGFPRDRVLDMPDLNQRITAGNSKPETFYLGHDYRAADLLRFFRELDRSNLTPTQGEAALRRSIESWGWKPETNGALITLATEDRADGVDASARATILRHELSHGVYFTSIDYAQYSRQFWEGTLSPNERARFRTFLAGEGYDISLDDLVINETQAYLMHTANPMFFNARAVGIASARIDQLRGLFLTGMPPSWLRDCTVVPTR